MRAYIMPSLLLLTVSSGSAAAQEFDPRPTLGSLITAFQSCGPPQVYQVLSPWMFQVIFQQTGGSGCYVQIASAGPISNMEVTSGKEFPIGPLYSVRVTHITGQVDWLIGFNRITSQVEYLNFQSATGVAKPTVDSRFDDGSIINEQDKGDDTIPPTTAKPSQDPLAAQCSNFPVMCPKKQ